MTKPEYVLGVDPGLYGGLALLGSAGLVWACNTPLLNPSRARKHDVVLTDHKGDVVAVHKGRKGEKARIDEASLVRDVTDHGRWWSTVAAIEKVGGIHGQSATASFSFGRSAGVIIGAALAAGLEVVEIPPAEWKFALKLAGKDKEASRALATEIFGESAAKAFWPRVKDDGVAEAALIAYYTRELRK